ncbi:MAG: hypothetical protein D6758_09125 [Gammaproteobacteria bacterium]|nr:MAG: hypothetical protein D6758_09125 [Gammaproteobacteria bacterium]
MWTLAACTAGPSPRVDVRPPEPATSRSAGEAGTPASSPRIAMQVQRVTPLPAARALLAQSDAALARGETARAWRLAQRAQRISPQASEVYVQMAQIRLHEGKVAQARQLLTKARALAGQDASLLQRIRDLAARTG